MKTFYLCIFLFICAPLSWAGDLPAKTTAFYNQLLSDQSAIQTLNASRPPIYIYTDFGGGKHPQQLIGDLQTSGELSSAAWKATLQQELYINDSAKPLTPYEAGIHLAKTFPYTENSTYRRSIQTIVVHVVDPGVGNGSDHPQPRALVLRKDGVLFIGPDNGTLSFACPSNSILQSWEIDADALTTLSGIDTHVGGTFHGRDIFCEAAFRISAGEVSPDEIGKAYNHAEIKNRFNYTSGLENAAPLRFERLSTERLIYSASCKDEKELFEQAFLLGVVQSSLYAVDPQAAITTAKKVFLPQPHSVSTEQLIAIENNRTGNIFIGPNNGLGSTFFKGCEEGQIKAFIISEEILSQITSESNNETIRVLIEQQPKFTGKLAEVEFFGSNEDVERDNKGYPIKVKAKIWLDLYGNIKTTLPSTVLNEVKSLNGSAKVILNQIQQPVIFADTFSQVPSDQLFIYNGSTGTSGLNPHRSKRYVELTANGVYGKFGIDFFEKDGVKPRSGDTIWFDFVYP